MMQALTLFDKLSRNEILMAQTLAAMGGPQGFVYAVTSITKTLNLLILLMFFILIAASYVMETTPNGWCC